MLDSTYISDISGVERLSNLEHMNISYTDVRDVSALNNAENLKVFLADATPIVELPTFTQTQDIWLELKQMPIKDYSSLGSIESFDTLAIDLNEIQDALPYIEGKPIRVLAWAGARIDSLEKLSGITITPGGSLGLAHSSVSSLDGLENFEGINYLDIHFCNKLTNLTPILQLQSLRWLTISSDMRELAEEQLQGAHFTLDYCDN
jgi:hypothetical protein